MWYLPHVALFYEGNALRLLQEFIKLSNNACHLSKCQKRHYHKTRGPDFPPASLMLARRQLWRAQNAACWNDRGVVWVVQESDLEGREVTADGHWTTEFHTALTSPPIHFVSHPVVPPHRQKTWVHHWLGKIPQRVFRTRSGDSGRNGTGEGFQWRTLGHTPSEYYIFTAVTECGHRGLPSLSLHMTPGDLESLTDFISISDSSWGG